MDTRAHSGNQLLKDLRKSMKLAIKIEFK
jgi:hypothetical protein